MDFYGEFKLWVFPANTDSESVKNHGGYGLRQRSVMAESTVDILTDLELLYKWSESSKKYPYFSLIF